MSHLKVDEYINIKQQQTECKRWASKLGKVYYGGTGGKGEHGQLISLTLAQGHMKSPTIYYQEHDGSNNYHPCPDHLIKYIEASIRDNFSSILSDALSRQDADVKQLSNEAVEEYKSLLDEANSL